MNRMIVSRLGKLAVFISIIIFIGCADKPQDQGRIKKVKVAAYAGDTGALVYIAEKQGCFNDNGLDVTINDYSAGKLAADALLNGDADISTATGFVFVSNSFSYPDLKVLGTVATAQTNELIA